MEKEEIQRIESLAFALFQGEHNELEAWLNDSSSIHLCRRILDDESSQMYATHFAIIVLKSHILQIFRLWAFEDQMNFGEWYLGLLYTKSQLFLKNQPLLALYSMLCGIILSYGMKLNQQYESIIMNILTNVPTEEDNLVLQLNVMSEVCEQMCEHQVIGFRVVLLPSIINYLISIFTVQHRDDAMLLALNTFLNALMFDVRLSTENQFDDFRKQKIQFFDTYRDNIFNPKLSSLLFEYATNPAFDSICYQILTILVSADPSYFPGELKYMYFLFYYKMIIDAYENNFNEESVYYFSNLVLRYKGVLEDYFTYKDYDYMVFMKQSYDFLVTMLNKEFIVTSFEAAHNMIKLWENPQPNEIATEMQTIIMSKYLDAVLDSIEFDPNNAIIFYGLDDNTSLQSFLTTVRYCTQHLFPEYSNVILSRLSNALNMSDMNVTKYPQIAFLIKYILGITVSIQYYPRKHEKDYYEPLANVYSQIIKVTQMFITNDLITNSFLTFVTSFRKLEFLCTASTTSLNIYKRMELVKSLSDMLTFIAETLILILHNTQDPSIIYQTSLSFADFLNRMLPSNNNIIMSLPIIQSLIALRIENYFPFLLNHENSRSRVVFHRTLFIVLVQKKNEDLCEQYLHLYDNFYADPQEMWGFLRDFTGFFEAAQTSKEYLIFFDYIFENHLQKLVEMVPTIQSQPSLMGYLLKMWSTMLKDESSLKRIQFEHHSPEGIILFKYTCNLLCAVVDSLEDTLKNEDKSISIKYIKYLFSILYHALSAHYIPFRVFETFNDDLRQKMMINYLKCLSIVSVTELCRYPKIESIIQKLNALICIKHAQLALLPEINCPEMLVNTINEGLLSMNNIVVQDAARGLQSLVENNQILITSVSREIIVKTMFYLWNQMMSKFNSDIEHCIYFIIAIDRNMFNDIGSKMQHYIISGHEKEFEEAYSSFVENTSTSISEMDFNNFSKIIKEFIDKAKVLLNATSVLFTN